MAYPEGTKPIDQTVHPTPIYETLAMGLIAYLLWRLRDRFQAGVLFSIYLVLAGAERFLVEFIRRNDDVLLGLTQAQLISLAMIAAGGAWLVVEGAARLAARGPARLTATDRGRLRHSEDRTSGEAASPAPTSANCAAASRTMAPPGARLGNGEDRPASTETRPMPVDRRRRLEAVRQAGGGHHRQRHQRRDQGDADDPHRERDRQPDERGEAR